jgi:hypothetical protein
MDKLKGLFGFLVQYYADPAWQDIVKLAIKRLSDEEVGRLFQMIDEERIISGVKHALAAKICKHRNPN